MIGSEFDGAGTEELGIAMYVLFNGSMANWMSDKEATELALELIAEFRGLELSEVRGQYADYVAISLQAQRLGYKKHGAPANAGDLSWWGSTEQLRFGKIVGDAFGIDSVFGALLSPTGGRVGPGDSEFLHWATQNWEAVNYHGQVHDAAGYLYNYHNVGPGYTYAKPDAPASQRNQAIMGQRSGIMLWEALLIDGN